MRLLLARAALLALGACGGENGGSSSGREERYKAFAATFGEHLKAGRYPEAYAMTAKRYRAGQTLDAFTAFAKEAERKYGKATTVGTSVNTVQADGPLGDGLKFPKDLPAPDRRARMLVRLADGPDAYNDCIYEVWLNIIDEDGADRIVSIEIPGLNM